MFSNLFSENIAVYEILWKNKVEPQRPRMAIQCGACNLHVGKLYRYTPRTSNTYYLFTVTVVMQMRLNLTFIRTLPAFLRIEVRSDYIKINVRTCDVCCNGCVMTTSAERNIVD
jgi:hypothetical protein